MSILDGTLSSSDATSDTEARRKKVMAQGALESENTAPTDRDRIAEKAMQSYLLEYGSRDYADIAEWAYKMADAMLLERNRGRSHDEET